MLIDFCFPQLEKQVSTHGFAGSFYICSTFAHCLATSFFNRHEKLAQFMCHVAKENKKTKQKSANVSAAWWHSGQLQD